MDPDSGCARNTSPNAEAAGAQDDARKAACVEGPVAAVETFEVHGIWDIDYAGPVGGLCFVRSVEEALRQLPTERIFVFTRGFSMYDHMSLLFLEHYAPYCVAEPGLDALVPTQLPFATLRVQGGAGTLSLCRAPQANDCARRAVSYADPPQHAICDTLPGLEFLASHQAKLVVARMEFLQAGGESGVERFLDYACRHFERASLRITGGLTDASSDAAENSVQEDAQRPCIDVACQLDLAESFRRRYGNMSLAVPLAKNEAEVVQAKELIARRFGGSVMPMIETPLMLARFEAYAQEFCEYIVGIGDLYSLLEGSDRTEIRYPDQLEALVADLFGRYVQPHCTASHVFYITSKGLRARLADTYPYPDNLVYLAKY